MATPMAVSLDPKADWQKKALSEIARLARTGQPFTADDIRPVTGPPPHPNHTGQAFRLARSQGLIEPAGYTTSRRRKRRGSAQRIWIGAPSDHQAHA